MRIIISPAKKMRVDTDSLPIQALPSFLDRTELLLQAMRSMDAAKLQSLWKCNEKIAALNLQRLKDMDLRHGLTPAILSYEGIQYQYMAPGVFTGDEFDYIQEHLRIVSGFYGLLRPFDGVTPYRLEMQTKLAVDGARDLYAFWGDRLANALCSETNCILNLASKEYYLSIQRHLMPSVRFITCVFGELKDALQHDHQVLTCLTLHSVGSLIVVAERLLQNAVDEFRFLLLTQLKSVLGHLSAGSL